MYPATTILLPTGRKGRRVSGSRSTGAWGLMSPSIRLSLAFSPNLNSAPSTCCHLARPQPCHFLQASLTHRPHHPSTPPPHQRVASRCAVSIRCCFRNTTWPATTCSYVSPRYTSKWLPSTSIKVAWSPIFVAASLTTPGGQR